MLPRAQIKEVLTALNWQYQVFVTIQEYSEDNTIFRCPIYIDIDSYDPQTALEQARETVRLMTNDFGVFPRVFFSGNKGYHIIVPYFIEHPRCHEIVKYYAKKILDIPCIDSKVYRTQAMFRLNGSPASHKGFFKTELTKEEFTTLKPSQIRDLSSRQRFIKYEYNPDHLNVDDIEYLVHTGIAQLPSRKTETESSGSDEFFPCLKALLKTPPEKGERHHTVFVLARHFRQRGLTASEMMEEFLAYDHWNKYLAEDPRDLPRTIESTFHGVSYPVGCHQNNDVAELMKAHCDKWCWKNPSFPEFKLVR